MRTVVVPGHGACVVVACAARWKTGGFTEGAPAPHAPVGLEGGCTAGRDMPKAEGSEACAGALIGAACLVSSLVMNVRWPFLRVEGAALVLGLDRLEVRPLNIAGGLPVRVVA